MLSQPYPGQARSIPAQAAHKNPNYSEGTSELARSYPGRTHPGQNDPASTRNVRNNPEYQGPSDLLSRFHPGQTDAVPTHLTRQDPDTQTYSQTPSDVLSRSYSNRTLPGRSHPGSAHNTRSRSQGRHRSIHTDDLASNPDILGTYPGRTHPSRPTRNVRPDGSTYPGVSTGRGNLPGS